MDKITKSLLEDFQASQALTKLDESGAFERFCNYCIISKEHTDTFNVEDVSTGSGDDTSIDGLAIIVNGCLLTDDDDLDTIAEANGYIDAAFIFVQSKTSSNFDGAQITSFLYGVKDFFSSKPSMRRNKFVAKAAARQEAIFKKAAMMTRRRPTCKLFYATTGRWTEDANLAGRMESGKRDLEELELFASVDFQAIDATRVQDLYQSTKRKSTAEFQFTNRAVLPEIEGVTEAYIGTLPAQEFLRLIEDNTGTIQKPLFYDNIRDFQGENSVNQEISATLSTAEGRHRFVVLNNGVTIIANSLRTVGHKFYMEDFQIVNGCQTSHILHHNRNNIDGVFVPVKVICTTNEDVTNSIIKGTNRQTMVKEEQLLAMSEFQKKLEMFFDSFHDKKKLYYERRSMQYNVVPGIEKVRVVTVQQQLRAFSSMFLDQPHRVHRSYSDLLTRIGSDIFSATHRLEPYYTSAFAQYKLEFLFRTFQIDARYKPTRFQLLMIFRHQIGGKTIPAMSANKMEKYCEKLLKVLWSDSDAIDAFTNAIRIIDAVNPSGLETDTIRNQSFTDRIHKQLT